jgi:hypothetical protein
LLGFEQRMVERVMRVQIPRMNRHAHDTPENTEREALILGLIACRALWLLMGIPLVAIAVALQVTVGAWCLVAYAGIAGVVAMSLWRARQSNRLKALRNAP